MFSFCTYIVYNFVQVSPMGSCPVCAYVQEDVFIVNNNKNSYNNMRRSKRYNQMLLEQRLSFRSEFCVELDIFDSGTKFPEWIYEFREPLLDKVSKPLKQLARLLKECGVSFKMKWPLEIDGRWKFADIYIPKTDTVVTVTSKADYLRPSLFMNDKADFFSRSHNVCQLDYDVFDGDHEKVLELISTLN